MTSRWISCFETNGPMLGWLNNPSSASLRAVAPSVPAGMEMPRKLVAPVSWVAALIAKKSLPIAMMIKESVNRAFEVSLSEGVRFERRVFHAAFATQDQKEGMAAFIAKRDAQFQGK